MSLATAKQKVSQQNTAPKMSPSAGPHGVAIAPPSYGIDFSDHAAAQSGGAVLQRIGKPEEEEKKPLQAKGLLQREAAPAAQAGRAPQQNRTGLPDALKSGVEALSGLSLDDVRVHTNSSKPAGLQALAYTQGTDIHVAPGQEKHLPHETWHVVQQKRGRVKPTGSIHVMPLSNRLPLEHEMGRIGEKTISMSMRGDMIPNTGAQNNTNVIQCVFAYRVENEGFDKHKLKMRGGKIIVDIAGTHGIDISFKDDSHINTYFEKRKDNRFARAVTMDIDDGFYNNMSARISGKKSKYDKLPRPVPTSDNWVKNKEDAPHFQVEWGPVIQSSIHSGKIETYQQYKGENDESENIIIVKFNGDETYYAYHQDYRNDFKDDDGVDEIMTLMEARYRKIDYVDAALDPK